MQFDKNICSFYVFPIGKLFLIQIINVKCAHFCVYEIRLGQTKSDLP